ncbi:MAG: hypothetical protein ACREFE_00820 [Limisphaerales bacterium]
MKPEIQKTIIAPALLALLSTLNLQPSTCFAQDFAPDALTGTRLTVTVTGGSAPFADSGGYKLFTSAAGTNYVVLGNAGAGFGTGTFHYAKTDTTHGILTFLDAQSGPGISMSLSFATTNAGTFSLVGTSGSQSGAFAVTNYLAASPPDLFLPGITNGQFQTYLSGQEGFVYSIETSTDLAAWSVRTNVTLSDWTTNLTATASGSSYFFRAKIQATDFAPDSLTNKTFNQTITGGELPLPTNGICQWMADTNDNGYQILGGPGTTNSSGTYIYRRTGPNSGVISYQDSLAGTVVEQMVFTAPDSGYFYATNSIGTASGLFTLADGAVDFLGNVQFTLDTSREGTLYFAADGATATLSVTNALGWVWTLSCPTDALLTPRVITMTPFASVDSGDALLPVDAGVQLEPDGMQFSDGVTLTVNPPALLGAHAALMMAENDGSDIYFVQSTNQANIYSTTLFHFSSAMVSNPSDQQWTGFDEMRYRQIEAAYDAALRDVEALQHSTDIPPPPPDYEAQCNSDANTAADKQIDEYIAAVFAKEATAIRMLLSATRELTLLTGFDDSQALDEVRTLIETTEFRKVDWLIGHYRNDPKKLTAVARLALLVARQDELLGGQGDPTLLPELAAWSARARDFYFDKLRNGHDYSMTSVILGAERMVELLDGPADTQILSDLKKALTFKLTITLDEEGTEESVYANGSFTVAFDTALDKIYGLLYGTGTMGYVRGQIGPCYLTTPDFAESATVDLTTCGTTSASISIFSFGSSSESYFCPGPPPGSFPGSFLASACVTAFRNYLTDSQYTFPCQLQNKSAEAVNQWFSGPSDNGTATVTFVLEHTPQ